MGGGPAVHTHANAHAWLRAAGVGVNISPSNIRHRQLERADYDLLARRVGHVRLGGSIAEPLLDWAQCPAAVRSGMSDADAQARIVTSDGGEPGTEHSFELFLQAAEVALAAGLKVVLNPFHQRFFLDVTWDTTRWVWHAVLARFPVARFPLDSVAFEMVNEPSNYPGMARVSDQNGAFQATVRLWVEMVRLRVPQHRPNQSTPR